MSDATGMRKIASLGLALGLLACAPAQPAPMAPAQGVPPPAAGAGADGADMEEEEGPVASNAGPTGDLQPYNARLGCTGASDDLLIENASVQLGPDETMQLMGSCSITIRNSEVNADGIALSLMGSGTFTVDSSTINGDLALQGSGNFELTGNVINGEIRLMGSGNVNMRNNRVSGGTSVMGTGNINDGGGNQIGQ